MTHPELVITRKQKIGMIVGMQLTLLLAALDQTIISTAMPKIVAELDGFSRYAWVTSAYLLTSTAALPLFGRLSDMYGRKWFLLGGAAFFIFASALCGLAGMFPPQFGDGMTQLITARGLQGIAGGIIMALAFTVIADLFPPAERGKYQGLFSAVFAISSVVGPALGGFITDNFSWRWIFYVNLPIGLIAVLVLFLAFPHISPAKRVHSIDLPGVFLLIAWIVPLMLDLTWIPELGIGAPLILSMLSLSLVSFISFIAVEAKAAEPIVPLLLFRDRTVVISSITLFITGMAMFATILFLPLFMQIVLGMTATHSGSVLTPMMLAMTIGSVICGQLVSRTGRYKALAVFALAALTGSLALLATMTIKTSAATAIAYTLMFGMALGLLMPMYTLIVQNGVAHQMVGIATASVQFFRSIGSTIGAAVFTSIMLDRYADYFHAQFPKGVGGEVARILDNPLHLGSLAGLDPVLSQHIKIAIADSLAHIFVNAAILCALACLVNCFLKEQPMKKKWDQPSPAPADPEVVV